MTEKAIILLKGSFVVCFLPLLVIFVQIAY